MKAAIYNPYLDSLGGGERYTMTFAKVLAEEGYDVDIEWADPSIKQVISKRFGLKLPTNLNIVESVNRGENYDLIFWVSDGSIPTLRASKNYIHFQVPFHGVNGKSLLNRMKLFRISKVVCNSKFTKKVIDKEYGLDSTVLYPPVDISSFKPKRKLNQICYVGRFSNLTQNKRHDVLIDQFKKISKIKSFKDWKLVLAGGAEVGSEKYLKILKTKTKGYNIEILESPKFDQIKEVLGNSKVFWSAAGFEVDATKNPEKVEHFGISLVEAMSAGCAPVVYGVGGPTEVIENGKNGYLWFTKKELVDLTVNLIKTSGLLSKISLEAVKASKKFGYEVFKKEVLQIIK